MKIAYIMGRGHNGSTVTDLILGNHADILATGEMNSGLGKGNVCSCGKSIRECEFWSQVIRRFEEHHPDLGFDGYVRQLRYIDRFWRIPQLITGIGLPGWFRTSYIQAEKKLFEILSNQGNSKVVFDSSKAFGRAAFMLSSLPNDAIVFYLVRDARGIIWSHIKRFEKQGAYKFLRKKYRPKSAWPIIISSAIAILGGEMVTLLLKSLYGKRIVTIRYEDICTDPEKTLKIIGDRLDVDTKEIASRIENGVPFDINHVIGGNHMRMKGNFVFQRDFKWKEEMPKRYSSAINIITFPYQKIHSYF